MPRSSLADLFDLASFPARAGRRNSCRPSCSPRSIPGQTFRPGCRARIFFHLRARLVTDNCVSAGQVAILRGIRDRIAHARQSAFINQVDDQLHLVQALEVRHLRLLSGLHQRLEAFLDQRRQTAAQHRLLAEQVALGFFLESGLQNAGASRPDAIARRHRAHSWARPRGILMNGQQCTARHGPRYKCAAPGDPDSWARSSPRPHHSGVRWS